MPVDPAAALPVTWARTRADMAADRRGLARLLGREPGALHRGLWSLRLYRLAFWMFHRPGLRFPARLLWAVNLILTRADLDPGGIIGGGTAIPDPHGVIIYGGIGPDCTIGRHAGVGGMLRGRRHATGLDGVRPEIAEGVVLGAGVMVLGALSIGRGVRIADRCTVMDNIPAGARVDARVAAWRAIRIPLMLAPRPAPADGLIGRIRTDVMRAVLENTDRPRIGALRFWGHLIMPSVAGIALFRVAQALHMAGWRRAGGLAAWLVTRVSGMVIHPASVIGPGLFIPHGVGVRFCGVAGPNLTLYPQAQVGPAVWPRLRDALPDDVPRLGADVRVGAQGEVAGAIRVGDGATVGVQVCLDRDLAAGFSAVPRQNWSLGVS